MRQFRTPGGTEWHSFKDVNNAALDCMNGTNESLLSLVSSVQIEKVKERVQAVKSWVDFGEIFAEFSDLLLHLPLPPQRLPGLSQAEMDLERELFSVFVPKQHLPKKKDVNSPKKSLIREGLHARVVGEKFHVVEAYLNESCQRLVDAATVRSTALKMDNESWEEIIDDHREVGEVGEVGKAGEAGRSNGEDADVNNKYCDECGRDTNTDEVRLDALDCGHKICLSCGGGVADPKNVSKKKISSGAPPLELPMRPDGTTPTPRPIPKKRNLVPSDVLKCASSRTLGGGDSYFIVQELFSGEGHLLVTPSHSESPSPIEIYIFDSGVVSIRTRQVYDIRSLEEMDGKEMVEVIVEHVMNIDLFSNLIRRHLLIESPSSQLAVQMSDMMGL